MNRIDELIKYIKHRFKITATDIDHFTTFETMLWRGEYDDGYPPAVRQRVSRFTPKLALIILSKSLYTGTPLQKKYNSINIQYAMIKCLSYFSAIRLYGELADNLIDYCRRYGLVEMGFSLSRILIKRYSMVEYHAVKLKRARKLQQTFLTEMKIEVLAENHYCDITMRFNRRKSYSPAVISDLRRINAELDPITSEIQNPKFILIKYLLRMCEADLSGDAEAYRQVCTEALAQFDALSHDYPHGKFIFANHRSQAYLRLHQYSEAEQSIEDAAKHFSEKTYAWVRNREMLYLVHMRQLHIDAASLVLADIRTRSMLKLVGSEMRDRIHLYRTFIDLFRRPEEIVWQTVQIDLDRYTSDVRGMNLSMIILDLIQCIMTDRLYDIDQAKRGLIRDQLSKYGGDNPRTKLFIRLLLYLPHAEEYWQRWVGYTNRIYGKMVISRDKVEEIEIVGYERLWQRLADEALQKHARYQAYKNPAVKSGYALAGL